MSNERQSRPRAAYRFVWVPCPDCGRGGTNGGCYEVERKGWLFWRPALITYDRGGSRHAEHYPTEQAAMEALEDALKPRPRPAVTKEFSL